MSNYWTGMWSGLWTGLLDWTAGPGLLDLDYWTWTAEPGLLDLDRWTGLLDWTTVWISVSHHFHSIRCADLVTCLMFL